MENNLFTFNFKNFRTGTIFFCSFFLVAFIAKHQAINSFMIEWDTNGLYGKSIDSRNPHFYKQYDVLFLGDSRSHEGLDPETFNASYFKRTGRKTTSYNAARPGMQSPFYYFIIKDYILQTKRPPKAVVVNASYNGLWKNAWLKALWLSYYNARPWQLKEALGNLPIHYAAQWAVKSHIPLIRYKKRINDLSKTLITAPKSFYQELERAELTKSKLEREENLGYFPKRGYQADEKKVDQFCTFIKGWERDLYLNYMKRFFDLAQEYNFKIFVYGYPWPEKCKQTPTFYDVRQYYFDKTKEVAQGNPNIHFIEYTDYWPLEYFANPTHLNHKGAQRLTKQIVKKIHTHLSE